MEKQEHYISKKIDEDTSEKPVRETAKRPTETLKAPQEFPTVTGWTLYSMLKRSLFFIYRD